MAQDAQSASGWKFSPRRVCVRMSAAWLSCSLYCLASCPMNRFLCTALFMAAFVGGPTTNAGPPPLHASPDSLLSKSRWEQLEQADQREQELRAAPVEAREVWLRIRSLGAIDGTSPAGQAELLAVVNDSEEIAYLRQEAFKMLAAGRAKQIRQTDVSDPAYQRELISVFCNTGTVPIIRQAALTRLAVEHVESPGLQESVLQTIRRETELHLCVTAIESLQDLGVAASEAVPVLVPMLDDYRTHRPFNFSDFYVSAIAMNALASYGHDAAEAIPRLTAELHSATSRPATRRAAQQALDAIQTSRDAAGVRDGEGGPAESGESVDGKN